MAKVHVVVFPFPLQGHIAPTLQLAHSLLAHPNVIISFVTFDSHAKALLSSKEQWYWQGIHGDSELRVHGLPDAGEQRSAGEWINETGQWLGGMNAVYTAFFANMKMEAPFRALLEKLQQDSHTPKISCIIADVTSFWVLSLASELGIPVASLWTASASFITACVNSKVLYEKGYIPLRGGEWNKQVVRLGIPGLDGTLVTDLPFSMHEEDPRDPGFSSDTMMSKVKSAKILLVNSCDQLEGEALGYLKLKVNPTLIPVGPLVPIPLRSGGSEAGYWEQDMGCLEWLDGKAENSVLYASFGSLSDFSFDEVLGLAEGLEASGHSFLWVVRKNLVRGIPEDFFPDFVRKVEGRGLVISWSPQAEVLCHKAVGGFITHCGWNSCMESLVAGVPMLAYPRFVDQSLNARLVCDKWKVGTRLNRGGGALTGAIVAESIKSMMESKEGGDLRSRARSFQSSLQGENHCLSQLLNSINSTNV